METRYGDFRNLAQPPWHGRLTPHGYTARRPPLEHVNDMAAGDTTACSTSSWKESGGTFGTFVGLTGNACQHVHPIEAFDFEQTESQIAWRSNLRRLGAVGFGEIFKNLEIYRS